MVGLIISSALWITYAELESAGRAVPFGGGKAAGWSERELNAVLLLEVEKKPKPAQFRRVKSLMVMVLLLETSLQTMKEPRARNLWSGLGAKNELVVTKVKIFGWPETGLRRLLRVLQPGPACRRAVVGSVLSALIWPVEA